MLNPPTRPYTAEELETLAEEESSESNDAPGPSEGSGKERPQKLSVSAANFSDVVTLNVSADPKPMSEKAVLSEGSTVSNKSMFQRHKTVIIIGSIILVVAVILYVDHRRKQREEEKRNDGGPRQ